LAGAPIHQGTAGTRSGNATGHVGGGAPLRSKPPQDVLVVAIAVLLGLAALAVVALPGQDQTPSPAPSSPNMPVAQPPTPAGSPGVSLQPPAVSTTASPSRTASASPTATPCAEDYLLFSCDFLNSLPTSGVAWEAMQDVADGSLGKADLTDQDNRHGVRTLAVALVYARTRDTAYRDKAHEAVMEVVGTEEEGSGSSILALGRQLGAYVLAADLIGLTGPDDQEFRRWLSNIRTRDLGGHGRWTVLTETHEDSINNWGAYAGASRIAASLYLEDWNDVERAAQVLRGFLGDRSAWSDWQTPSRRAREWACEPYEGYTPVNPPCERDEINLDGAIPADISRSGGLERWPPGRSAKQYSAGTLEALGLQAELLSRAGYDPWQWSDRALLRAALFLERAEGWNPSSTTYHVPWLFNERYSLSLPTEPAGFGRIFGYTDWLYGD
jgi:hypothetical protein